MTLPGREPEGIKCGFCPRTVIDMSAVWDEGVAYHEHCFKIYLANELKKYSKKMQLGTLTMAEAKFTEDLQYKLDLCRKQDTPPKKPKKQLASNCQTLVVPERRNASLKSVHLDERKQLEHARGLRWAFEKLAAFEEHKFLDNGGEIKQIGEIKPC